MSHYDKALDMSGHKCPVPVMRIRKIFAEMNFGEILHLIVNDPGSRQTIPAFVRITGNELVEMKEEAGIFHYYIRKAGS